MRLLLLVMVVRVSCVPGDAMFHYNSESCDDLMPRKMAMKKMMTTVAPEKEESMANGTTEEPSTSAEPEPEPEPTLEKGDGSGGVSLSLSDVVYRRHRGMTVTLKSETDLTAFMLQAVTVTNGTRVGRFEKIPKQTSIKDCGESDSRVIGDNGMDRQGLNEIAFTWMPPDKDVGKIQFQAGILINHTYYTIESDEMSFKDYPIDSSSCGKDMMCYRSCSSDSTCPASNSEYIFTSKVDENMENLVITLGAYLPQNLSYVAIGFTNDSRHLTNADITACLKNDQNVISATYTLEKYGEEPEIQDSKNHMLKSDVENDYVWCTFRRSIRGPGPDALPLSLKFYHVYLMGEYSNSTIILPDLDDIMVSEKAMNLTAMANMIDFNHAAFASPASLPLIATLLFVATARFYNF